MKFVSDLNRELLPLLNLLASINHLSIYVGTLAASPSEDQRVVSLDVSCVSLNGGLLQFNCDLGDECDSVRSPAELSRNFSTLPLPAQVLPGHAGIRTAKYSV
jgi:hypothetical protein